MVNEFRSLRWTDGGITGIEDGDALVREILGMSESYCKAGDVTSKDSLRKFEKRSERQTSEQAR